MSINAIESITNQLEVAAANESVLPEAPASDFGQSLLAGVDNTNASIQQADALLQAKALGESVSTHELMLAMEQAKLSLQLTVEVRNRLLEGYQEIMRMQL